MTNPYESPRETSQPTAQSVDRSVAPLPPLKLLFKSWLLGASFGAFGAFLLSVLFVVAEIQPPIPLPKKIAYSIFLIGLGFSISGIGGVVTGCSATATVALFRCKASEFPTVTSGIAAIAGLILGNIGGIFVSTIHDLDVERWMLSGSVAGLATGTLAGWRLGRLLKHEYESTASS